MQWVLTADSPQAQPEANGNVHRVAWPAVMKGWDQWRDVYSPEGQLLFAGLRAKVSVFHGQMTRIVPHTTTGALPPKHVSSANSFVPE